ncbi:hypothetical protein [Streptomyces sp. JV184]|uniref:hypothetical protein n=1 Tax=Streptomyces sp. JV184 TaxID=858637 RepID=UPI002E79CCDA|nr:hypothetical protein [Streptomyces sp. JV184]MEE1742966.1 hypothetical protein [Streptomyces sp. JV184]
MELPPGVAGAAAELGGVGAGPLGLLMRSLLTTDPLPLPVPVWLPFAAGAAAALDRTAPAASELGAYAAKAKTLGEAIGAK